MPCLVRAYVDGRRIATLPESAKETQGVDRAAVRGGQAVARDAPLPDEDTQEGQRRSLMTATGQNIKRLLSFKGRGPETLAQAAALRPPARLWLDLDHRRSGAQRRKRRVDPTFFNALARSPTWMPMPVRRFAFWAVRLLGGFRTRPYTGGRRSLSKRCWASTVLTASGTASSLPLGISSPVSSQTP